MGSLFGNSTDEKKNDKPFGSFGILPAVHSFFSSLGSTPPVDPNKKPEPSFTLKSQAAPVSAPTPMKDLIPGYPNVPIDPADMPLQDDTGFGATIKGGNIYATTDDAGNVTGTLSALETLRDMKNVQDSMGNIKPYLAPTFATPEQITSSKMPTLLDSLSGEALGQQMQNMPLGTVATPELLESPPIFKKPEKLFGILDPVYASPQKSFDAQLRMGDEKDSGIGTTSAREPIFSYFQKAYKGGIPDRFLRSFLTRFGYSPEYIDTQLRVNEDGEIIDAQGNLIEDLPNIALIGEKIKQELGE